MLENYLNIAMISSTLVASSKEEAVRFLARGIAGNYPGLNVEVIASAMLEREGLGSTAIEAGIAIPHAKIDGISKIIISVARCNEGINFEAADGKPTYLFFALLAPINAAGEHLKVLARLSKILGMKGIKERLLTAEDADEIYNTLLEADNKLS